MKFINSAFVVAAIPAILYTLASAYYNGLLSSLNLDMYGFRREFQPMLYYGYLKAWEYLFLLTFYSSFVFLATWLIATNFEKPALILKENIGNRKNTERLKKFQFILKPLLVLIFILVILFIHLFILRLVENKGFIAGKEMLSSYQDNELFPTVNIKIAGETKSVKWLLCGTEKCAAIDTFDQKIYVFSSSTDYTFDATLTIKK